MRGILFVVALLVASGAANAQPSTVVGSEARFSSQPVADDRALQTLEIVTANITGAIDEHGRNLRPLTAEELATPLLDIELVKEIMDVAQASAAGLACDLDWAEANYRKLMKRERARGDRSTHQIAAISMIHGYTSAQHDVKIACPADRSLQILDFYKRKWP